MKTIILAGGQGTRLSEETDVRPKPMVEIGHRPILWHILKIYAHYGYNDFLIALRVQGRAHQALHRRVRRDGDEPDRRPRLPATVEAHRDDGRASRTWRCRR